MNKEEQTWQGIFLVIPVILGYTLADTLAADGQMKLLYGALFSGAGAMVGAGIYYLIREKGRGYKIALAAVLLAVGILAPYIVTSEPTDEEILKREWSTQTIGQVQFDSPEKLTLITAEIPDSAKWFYKELKMYSNENRERLITFIDSRITVDTLSIVDAYSSLLERLLVQHDLNPEKLNLETFSANEEEISAMFTFDLKGKSVSGYGYMFKKGEVLESIWLIPITKGFSRELIEEFEAGIYPNYK
jgi:hypothetical protein